MERNSKDDLICDERKVKSNAIDYQLPIDSSNLAYHTVGSLQNKPL